MDWDEASELADLEVLEMASAADAVVVFRQQQEALGHGCSDGYCVIEKTVGQHTNGGCHCLHFTPRQRVGTMLRAAQDMAEGIEALADAAKKERKGHEKEIAVWSENYAALERKLAKAAEALDRLARLGNEPHFGNSRGNEIARAALATLKGRAHDGD